MSINEEDEKYFSQPEFRDLLARYEEAVCRGESIYMDADELTDIAEYYMTQERERDADQAISLALALHPDSVDPQVFLARKQLFLGNTEEAWRISRSIVDQEDREVKFLNAEILIKEERGREAVVYLLHVYRTLDGERDHFLYDSAGLFMDYGQWEYAMMWVNRLERLFPDYSRLKRMKAELLVCLGRYDEAIVMLNEILDENPYHKDVWNLLAESQGATERFAEAIDSAEYVLAIDKDDRRALATKASCLFHMNQPQKAHELYEKYLQDDSEDANVLYLDAVCLASLGHYADAVKQVDHALNVCSSESPQYVHMLLEKAYVESKLHRADKALEAIAFAESLRMDDMDCEYSLLRGQVLLENGFDDEAVESFTKALRASKTKRNTLMIIGIAYGEAGHYGEAIQMMLNVQDKFPDTDDGASPLPYLAYYYYQTGDKITSLAYLQKAAEADRQSTEQLFSSIYPGVAPDEYYLYAYRDLHGHFPDIGK